MQISELCSLKFSTCYKACSIHGIEVVLRSRRVKERKKYRYIEVWFSSLMRIVLWSNRKRRCLLIAQER